MAGLAGVGGKPLALAHRSTVVELHGEKGDHEDGPGSLTAKELKSGAYHLIASVVNWKLVARDADRKHDSVPFPAASAF